MFKGSANRTSLDIAIEQDRLGGNLDAFTSHEETGFAIKVIDDQLPDVPAARLLAAIKRPGSRTVVFAITGDAAQREGLQLARQGADGMLLDPVEPVRLLALCDTIRRQRSLLRIEELLEDRGRALENDDQRIAFWYSPISRKARVLGSSTWFRSAVTRNWSNEPTCIWPV